MSGTGGLVCGTSSHLTTPVLSLQSPLELNYIAPTGVLGQPE